MITDNNTGVEIAVRLTSIKVDLQRLMKFGHLNNSELTLVNLRHLAAEEMLTRGLLPMSRIESISDADLKNAEPNAPTIAYINEQIDAYNATLQVERSAAPSPRAASAPSTWSRA